MQCPQCFTRLKLIKGPPSRIGCPRCGGRWHSFQVFAKKVGPGAFEELLNIARKAAPTGKTCPHCEKKMWPLKTTENQTPLDVCFHYESIWFDFLEFESFREKPNPLGEAFVKMRQSAQPFELNGVRVETFEVGLFGELLDARSYDAPISDQRRVRGFPFITYAVALVCLLVYLKTRNDIADSFSNFAFITGGEGLEQVRRLFGSFFLHESLEDFLANMFLFCLIAASAEDVSSPFEFLVVLFGGHILGTLVGGAFASAGTSFAGAGAGVFSVLVYYSLLFPKSRFQVTDFFKTRNYETHAIRYSMPIQLFVFAMVVKGVVTGQLAHLAGGVVGLLMGLNRKRTF